jgi:hypothetical protein
MADGLSHAEVHAKWSTGQLMAFYAMSCPERLNAVKSGALEHWTADDRNAALDILSRSAVPEHVHEEPGLGRFEPASQPIPQFATNSPLFDRPMITAMVGWALLVGATAGRAYGLY